jgi:serine/threonine-protein kinase HipA
MNIAIVKIWGQQVGAVAWDDRTGLASFEYDTTFNNLNWDSFAAEVGVSKELIEAIDVTIKDLN